MSQRTYHDPLHRGIQLDRQRPGEAMVMALVETAPFQRLRRVRQLGPAFRPFMALNRAGSPIHSACSISPEPFERLLTLNPAFEPHRPLLYAAALLHDIGHGPLSHTGEEMFGFITKAGQPGSSGTIPRFRTAWSRSIKARPTPSRCSSNTASTSPSGEAIGQQPGIVTGWIICSETATAREPVTASWIWIESWRG